MKSHFPKVWFSEYLARSDLEEARQLEAVGWIYEVVLVFEPLEKVGWRWRKRWENPTTPEQAHENGNMPINYWKYESENGTFQDIVLKSGRFM